MSTRTISKPRTLGEWYAIVTEARQSGLTDSEWCRRNNISRNTFNSAVKRLRSEAYALPKKSFPAPGMDLTSSTSTPPRQEVVKIGIVDAESLTEDIPKVIDQPSSPYQIEISFSKANIRISNGADPYLVSQMISALRSCL